MNKLDLRNCKDVESLASSYVDTAEGELAWLLEVTETTQAWSALSALGDHNAQQLVVLVARLWEDMKATTRSKWEGDLVKWALYATGKSESRVRGMINVYETYYSDAHEIDAPEGINFNEIAPTKLLVAAGVAKRGKMTPEAWDALQNPATTVEGLKEHLPKIRRSNKTYSLSYYEKDGYVWATDSKEHWIVCQLNDDMTTPAQKRSVSMLLRALGIGVTNA